MAESRTRGFAAVVMASYIIALSLLPCYMGRE